jgi:CubicO group peptidase (beta-lactamase class C family)
MLILVNVGYASGVGNRTDGIKGNEKQQIDQVVYNNMKKGRIPGVSLVIVEKGKTVYKKGYGYADVKTQRPVTPDTKFQLGSLTKSFTGLAIKNLADKGLIKFGDSVSTYLPWFHVRYHGAPAKITIKQLMEHSSGIPTKAFIDVAPSPRKDALKQGVKSLVGSTLSSAPGEKFTYSNVNYNILGLIIQKVSGQSYTEYMKQHIFTPLQLTNTYVRDKKPLLDVATGYKPSFYGVHDYAVPFSLSQPSSGFIISSGNDMEKWLKFNMGLIQGDGLSRVQISKDTPFHYYGGLEFDAKENQVQHAGNLENYSSYMVMDPENNTGVIVLANLNSTYTTAIGENIISLVQGHQLSKGDSDVYLLTDQVSSTLILVMGGLSLLLIWPIIASFKQQRLGRRKYKGSPLSFTWIGLLFSLLSGSYYLAVKLPTIIFPNADWGFMNDWMPNTTFYGVLAFLCFLTLLVIHLSIRILFSKRDRLYKNRDQSLHINHDYK